MYQNQGMRHRLDLVNEFARQGYNLRIRCNVCDHVVDASAIEMMGELHRRSSSLSIDKLEERLKCRICGWPGATIAPTEAHF